MDKRILGKDLQVSAIGYGCMGMSHAYGTVSTQKEAEQLIERRLIVAVRFLTQQKSMEQQMIHITMKN